MKNRNLTEKAGQILMEAFETSGDAAVFKEKYFKEEMTTTTGSGAYTTMLSGVLYQAAVDNIQDILGLVTENRDLMSGKGFGAYKIPIDQPTTAVEVAEGAVVNYFDEGVTSITVEPRKVVVGTAITWEMTKRGMGDFVKYVLQKSANAISRKLGGDVVNGLSAGAAAGNAQTGGMTYTNIVNAEAAVNSATTADSIPYAFAADKLVIAASSYGTIQLDTDWKQHVYRATAKAGSMTINEAPLMFGNMEIVVTPLLTASLGLVLDAKVAAILVKESDLETFEERINGRPYDTEVVGVMSYVLAVIYSDAIATISA